MLKEIQINYIDNKYVVTCVRTRYYFGWFKGSDYVDKEIVCDSILQAKDAALKYCSNDKIKLYKNLEEAYSYADSVRKSKGKEKII
jgi:hypothetical protein